MRWDLRTAVMQGPVMQGVGDVLRNHQDHRLRGPGCDRGPLEADYLTVGLPKIYVGRSRHGVLAWLRFLP